MIRNTADVKNIYGQTITVFENDYVGNRIVEKGIYEKELLDYSAKILRNMQQPVVLDVGANIGNHALNFALSAKHVYAFEPVPDIFSVLTKNIQQNNLSNIHCVNAALSHENGSAQIYIFHGNMGATSFDKHHDNVAPVTVSKRIGDEFIAEQGITNVDFIKIDTEGHESFVLAGLQNTIKQFRPFVIVEWHDPVTISRFKEANTLNFLFSDYDIYVLGSNFDFLYWSGKPLAKLRHRLTKLFSKKRACLYAFDQTKAYKNILLVPKEKGSLLPN